MREEAQSFAAAEEKSRPLQPQYQQMEEASQQPRTERTQAMQITQQAKSPPKADSPSKAVDLVLPTVQTESQSVDIHPLALPTPALEEKPTGDTETDKVLAELSTCASFTTVLTELFQDDMVSEHGDHTTHLLPGIEVKTDLKAEAEYNNYLAFLSQ